MAGFAWYCVCVVVGRPYDGLTEALCVASAAAATLGFYRLEL
jgi:hypothetical protein